MKQKIKELIQHHKSACEEVKELLNELNGLSDIKMSEESNNALINAKIRAEEEHAWRGVFISQLEDLL